MKEIRERRIVIDITNICHNQCSNCTRLIGNYPKNKLYSMDLDYFEKAIISVKDYPGIIGILGGEPTLHTEFIQICKIIRRHLPKNKVFLCTAKKIDLDFHYYHTIIHTFGKIFYDDKDNNSFDHQPILISSFELDPNIDPENIIRKCWNTETCGACITNRGAWFCEVAGSLSNLLDGPDGLDVIPGWWKLDYSHFRNNMNWACKNCGLSLDLGYRNPKEEIDDISPGIFEKIKKSSPKIKQKKYKIFEKKS